MTIRNFENLKPQIHADAWVDDMALVIGDVSIGRDSGIWPMCVLRGDINRIVIGERTNIQDGSVLHVTHGGEYSIIPEGAALTIGSGVTVGHSVVLHGCTVEDECLIGIGAVIMDRAIVRKHALVAAGTVVGPGKDLTGGYIWLGNPVRQGRALTAKELSFLEYSANHYVALKNRHLKSSKSIE
ncbi:MAG TPA: gamma carbonic anhydrase family protein [Gammaproteobacteria bacterium]